MRGPVQDDPEPPAPDDLPDAVPRRRGPSPTLVVALVLVALSLGGVAVVALRVDSEPSQPAPDDLASLTGGDLDDIRQPPPRLPEATLEGFAGAEEVHVTDLLDGRPLVLNFWATWCAPCVAEMPDLQRLHVTAGDDVRVVGVDTQDSPLNAEPFVEELGIDYDLVADPQGEYFTQLQSFGMPTTLFVGAEGDIRYRHTGPMTFEQMLQLVAEHLGVHV